MSGTRPAASPRASDDRRRADARCAQSPARAARGGSTKRIPAGFLDARKVVIDVMTLGRCCASLATPTHDRPRRTVNRPDATVWIAVTRPQSLPRQCFRWRWRCPRRGGLVMGRRYPAMVCTAGTSDEWHAAPCALRCDLDSPSIVRFVRIRRSTAGLRLFTVGTKHRLVKSVCGRCVRGDPDLQSAGGPRRRSWTRPAPRYDDACPEG